MRKNIPKKAKRAPTQCRNKRKKRFRGSSLPSGVRNLIHGNRRPPRSRLQKIRCILTRWRSTGRRTTWALPVRWTATGQAGQWPDRARRQSGENLSVSLTLASSPIRGALGKPDNSTRPRRPWGTQKSGPCCLWQRVQAASMGVWPRSRNSTTTSTARRMNLMPSTSGWTRATIRTWPMQCAVWTTPTGSTRTKTSSPRAAGRRSRSTRPGR